MMAEVTKERVDELSEAIHRLTADAQTMVGHFGIYRPSPENTVQWSSIWYGQAAEEIPNIPNYKVAQALGVLGNEVRIAILRALLTGPQTAAALVKNLGLTTTGQAYHHLRELERAGYLTERGGSHELRQGYLGIFLTALAVVANLDIEAEQSKE